MLGSGTGLIATCAATSLTRQRSHSDCVSTGPVWGVEQIGQAQPLAFHVLPACLIHLALHM